MATEGRVRNAAATAVGYVIVAIILWYVLKWLVGTLFWLIRTLFLVIVLIALIFVYVKLKSPKRTT